MLSKKKRIVSAAVLVGVVAVGLGATAINTRMSMAAEENLANTFTYKTVSGSTKTPHTYTIKSYGRYEYDSNGDNVADAVIDADDMRKLAAAVNSAQAIADKALGS